MAQLIQQVVGQRQAKERLEKAFARGRIAPVQLFVGPSGVGKSKLAWAVAQRLLCERSQFQPACGQCGSCLRVAQGQSESVLWVEPDGAQIKIEQARQVLEFLSLKAWSGSRVVIVQGADLLNTQAANALLKLFEEPPPHSYIFLLASQLNSVLPTLRSRSQVLRFHSLSKEELWELLGSDTPEWVVTSAQGRQDVAQQLMEPEAVALRDQVFGGLHRWLKGETSVVELMEDYVSVLGSQASSLVVVNFLQQILRDAVFYQNRLKPLIHPHQEALVQELAHQPGVFDLAQGAFQLERDLRANVERKLCFEAFFYQWDQRIRRHAV